MKETPSEKAPSEHVQEQSKSVSNKYQVVVSRKDSKNSEEEEAEDVKSKVSSNIPAQSERSRKVEEAPSKKSSRVEDAASKRSAKPSERSVKASEKSATPSEKPSHSARVEGSHLEAPAVDAADPSQKDPSVRSGRTHSRKDETKSERPSQSHHSHKSSAANDAKSSKKGSEAASNS